MEKIPIYLFAYCRNLFLLRTCILVMVMFRLLQGRVLYFAVFLWMFSGLIILLVCFDSVCLVKQGFFLLSKLLVGLEISIRQVEIYKHYGLGLIFVRLDKLFVYDLQTKLLVVLIQGLKIHILLVYKTMLYGC